MFIYFEKITLIDTKKKKKIRRKLRHVNIVVGDITFITSCT